MKAKVTHVWRRRDGKCLGDYVGLDEKASVVSVRAPNGEISRYPESTVCREPPPVDIVGFGQWLMKSRHYSPEHAAIYTRGAQLWHEWQATREDR